MTLVDFIRLCSETSTPLKWVLSVQGFKNLNIITVLECRTQAIIRNHFQAVFQTFLKDKEKIITALESLYSKAKLEATNYLIKLIKRNIFGFRNFDNFKTRILVALNIKKERTDLVLSRVWLFGNPLQLTNNQKKILT